MAIHDPEVPDVAASLRAEAAATQTNICSRLQAIIQHYTLTFLVEHGSGQDVPKPEAQTPEESIYLGGYVARLWYNGHCGQVVVDTADGRTLVGSPGDLLALDRVRKATFEAMQELAGRPKGYLSPAAINRWKEAERLMAHGDLKEAWLLARDCMVELADVVCSTHGVKPDELTEWEKKPVTRIEPTMAGGRFA